MALAAAMTTVALQPNWTATYNMSESVSLTIPAAHCMHSRALEFPAPAVAPDYHTHVQTIMMPCNTSGFFSPSNAARYGVADFDWSNAREACESRNETRLYHNSDVKV